MRELGRALRPRLPASTRRSHFTTWLTPRGTPESQWTVSRSLDHPPHDCGVLHISSSGVLVTPTTMPAPAHSSNGCTALAWLDAFRSPPRAPQLAGQLLQKSQSDALDERLLVGL